MRTCLADIRNPWRDESGSVTNAHAHSFVQWLCVNCPASCTLSKEKGTDLNEGSWARFPRAAAATAVLQLSFLQEASFQNNWGVVCFRLWYLRFPGKRRSQWARCKASVGLTA